MIRRAGPADLDRIVEIYNQAVDDRQFANCDTAPIDRGKAAAYVNQGESRYLTFVCESSDRIRGWAALKRFSLGPDFDRVSEIAVYVDRASRNGTIGGRLLLDLLSRAPRLGFSSLIAIVLSRNLPSIRGLKAAGFMPEVTLQDVAMIGDERVSSVWMQKTLMAEA